LRRARLGGNAVAVVLLLGAGCKRGIGANEGAAANPASGRELRIGVVSAAQPQRRNELIIGMNVICAGDDNASTDACSQPHSHIAPRTTCVVRLAIRRG
jgi:hypothetical protein